MTWLDKEDWGAGKESWIGSSYKDQRPGHCNEEKHRCSGNIK
jgi:hypothetical protein